MLNLLLGLLLAGSAQAGGIIQGGFAAPKAPGISTGAVTTAALTGDGQSGNPLGVNSSSVAVYDSNRNLTVPYGVVAGTGSFSGSVTASSVTAQTSISVGTTTASSYGVNVRVHINSTANLDETGSMAVISNSFSETTVGRGGILSLGGTYNGGSPTIFGTVAGFKESATASNSAGYLLFATPTNGGLQSERMRITSAGNVGIGTASPGTLLNVSSGIITANGTGSGINIDKDTDAVLRCGTGNYTTGCMARYFNTWAGFSIYDNQANTLSNGATGRGVNGDYNGLSFYNGGELAWSSTADAAGAQDTNISRVSAGVLGVGTGAAGSVAGTLNAAALNISGSTFTVASTGLSTFGGPFQPWARTKAQVDALAASALGQYIHVSDTTLPGLCVSTGTAISQWRKIESATLGCGTNN